MAALKGLAKFESLWLDVLICVSEPKNQDKWLHIQSIIMANSWPLIG